MEVGALSMLLLCATWQPCLPVASCMCAMQAWSIPELFLVNMPAEEIYHGLPA